MFKVIKSLFFVVLAASVLQGCSFSAKNTASPSLLLNSKSTMKITSPAFSEGQDIPSKFTCDGVNVNPELQLSGVPASTQSLAIIVDDPDSQGGNWSHWLMWNIKPDTVVISENSVPSGAVQGTNDFGEAKYGGPCPGRGKHHYQYKVYALDVEFDLTSSAIKSDLIKAINGHVLDQAVLVGLYQKK